MIVDQIAFRMFVVSLAYNQANFLNRCLFGSSLPESMKIFLECDYSFFIFAMNDETFIASDHLRDRRRIPGKFNTLPACDNICCSNAVGMFK